MQCCLQLAQHLVQPVALTVTVFQLTIGLMKAEVTEDMLIQAHALQVIGATTHVHFMHMYRKFLLIRQRLCQAESYLLAHVKSIVFLILWDQSHIITAPSQAVPKHLHHNACSEVSIWLALLCPRHENGAKRAKS